MHNKLAHTAEHAFMGSLQKLLGMTLNVRKVEHREKDSNVIVRLPDLDLQTVKDAQYEVNSLIQTGRKIKTYSFQSMDDAKKRFPNLRANEARIKQKNEPIRVIEIEGHDVAACAMDHTSNLRECEFFLITRVSKTGGGKEYEIGFAVQNQAKEASIILSQKLLNICRSLGANMNTVENTVNKMSEERNVCELKLKHLTEERLTKIESRKIGVNEKVKLIQDILYGLDDREIQDFVGKKISISQENTIVLIVHIPNDVEEMASVIFARTQPLERIDCSKLFSQLSFLGVKGGGKPSFVRGVIKKENLNLLINQILEDVNKLL
jgi:alanyl-tRNA synthetase